MSTHGGDYTNPDPRDPSRSHERANFLNDDSSEETWVTDEEVEALAMERDIMGDSIEMQAERILRDNLPAVVHGIVKLARSANSETVKLNAQKYIIDRNLGKIVEPATVEGDPLMDMMQSVVRATNESITAELSITEEVDA